LKIRIFDFLFGPPNVENLKSKKDVQGLIKALNYKKDRDIRARAAAALADLFGPPDVENLKARGDVEGVMKALEYKKDNDVREKVAAAIREIKDERAAEILIQVLEGEDAAVRAEAAMALGEIRAEKAVRPLIRVLKDEDEDLREKAAMALGAIGDERAIEPLIYALGEDGGKVEMIKEISKCDEEVFTCPYCHGRGSVKGWSSNPKGSIAYTGSKHGCNQCEGTGKLRSMVEGKLKIKITKLPLVPLFTIKEEINLFHKEGGPVNVGTVTTLNWGGN
jgi:hypothetical protein